MKSMMSHALKVFLRNKEFIMLVIILPELLLLLMTFLLPYNETHTIGVLNNSSNTIIVDSINDIEGINVISIKEDEISEKIMNGNIELAVIINNKDGKDIVTIYNLSDANNEIKQAINLAIKNANNNESTRISINDAKRGNLSVNPTLAFMLFKLITGGTILVTFMISERNRKIKDRIMLSNIKESTYIGGLSLVFLIGTFISSTLYYLTALVLNFDFGMNHSIYFLLMLYVANIFSVAFAIFISSLTNNEETASTNISGIFLILSFFSGIFFPYKYMPKAFQYIGYVSPQRWISLGIENIQKTGSLLAAMPSIIIVLSLSLILFIFGIIKTKNLKKG